MSRRNRIALWVALIVAAGLIYWLAVSNDLRPDLPQATKSVFARATAWPADSKVPNKIELKLREPARAAVADIVNKAPGKSEVAAVDDGSACGLDKYKITPEAAKFPPEIVASARQSLDQVIAQLQTSTIERERALGLYVQSMQRGQAAFDQQLSSQRDCYGDVLCIAKARAAREQASLPQVEALARLAATAVDPASYAAAFYRCIGMSSRACKPVTAANWAAMDPSNAVPWLHVANAAAARNDPTGRDEALRRASALPVYDTRLPPVFQLMQADSVLAQSVPRRLAISLELINYYSTGKNLSPYDQLISFCAPPADEIPGRVDTCSQLADKILQQDGEINGRLIGTALAKHAHWPADKITALNDEHDAMLQVIRQGEYFPTSGMNCSGYEKFNLLLSETARVGMVAMLQQRIGESGKTIAVLAEERRDAVKKQREEYEKASARK